MRFWGRKKQPSATTPTQAAAYWMARLRSDLSADEIAAFDAWRAETPENALAFDRLNRIWSLAGQAQIAHPAEDRRRPTITWTLPAWQWAPAACVAIAVLSGAFYWGWNVQFMWRPSTPTANVQAAVNVVEYKTAVGQTTTIALSDGSRLTLDTNSVARVVYTTSERGIYLLSGRAAFDVAKHQKRPFVVHADDRNVTATGTSFDVRKAPEHLEVTLSEGRVIVSRNTTGNNQQGTVLTPGKRLVSRHNAPDSVRDVNLAQTESWRSGRLFFDNQRLDEAIDEMNRYSTKQIILVDATLKTYRIGGVFHTGRPTEVVEGLRQIYPITYAADASGNIVVRLKSDASKHYSP